MSMLVMCYTSDVKGYDRRRSELSNAPLSCNETHPIYQYREIYP